MAGKSQSNDNREPRLTKNANLHHSGAASRPSAPDPAGMSWPWASNLAIIWLGYGRIMAGSVEIGVASGVFAAPRCRKTVTGK